MRAFEISQFALFKYSVFAAITLRSGSLADAVSWWPFLKAGGVHVVKGIDLFEKRSGLVFAPVPERLHLVLAVNNDIGRVSDLTVRRVLLEYCPVHLVHGRIDVTELKVFARTREFSGHCCPFGSELLTVPAEWAHEDDNPYILGVCNHRFVKSGLTFDSSLSFPLAIVYFKLLEWGRNRGVNVSLCGGAMLGFLLDIVGIFNHLCMRTPNDFQASFAPFLISTVVRRALISLNEGAHRFLLVSGVVEIWRGSLERRLCKWIAYDIRASLATLRITDFSVSSLTFLCICGRIRVLCLSISLWSCPARFGSRLMCVALIASIGCDFFGSCVRRGALINGIGGSSLLGSCVRRGALINGIGGSLFGNCVRLGAFKRGIAASRCNRNKNFRSRIIDWRSVAKVTVWRICNWSGICVYFTVGVVFTGLVNRVVQFFEGLCIRSLVGNWSDGHFLMDSCCNGSGQGKNTEVIHACKTNINENDV